MSEHEVALLVTAVREELGNPEDWAPPVEFRNSLALCALNSVYSLNGHSTAGKNVLRRYRQWRRDHDVIPETDSGPELLALMEEAGGPRAFALDVLDARRPLSRSSRLRTEGIYDGLTALQGLSILTAEDLRETHPEQREVVRRAWIAVPGLGKLSWRYLLMNAGVEDEAKIDVMLNRYIARVLGSPARSHAHARDLLTAVAEQLGVKLRSLDRAIWLHESGPGKKKKRSRQRNTASLS